MHVCTVLGTNLGDSYSSPQNMLKKQVLCITNTDKNLPIILEILSNFALAVECIETGREAFCCHP